MKPQTKIFENGLRLVFKKVEEDRPATLFVCVKTGSFNEDNSNNGISHFIEHLNFKGTKKRSSKQISVEFEEIGANANAYTSKFHTCYFATGLKDKIENYFDILSDIILNSCYDEAEVEKEKQVIFEEIDMYQDDPESVCADEFYNNFYFNTALQKTVLGKKEILQNLKRQDILNYVKKFYVPQNMVVSVVGAFDFNDVDKLTKKYFVDGFGCCNNEKFDFEQVGSVLVPDKKFSFIKKDVAQTQIIFGFPSENIFSSNKMAINLLCFMLGGGMSSRLFQKVREEHGLVYSISSLPEFTCIGGDIAITLGTNSKNQLKAMQLIKDEIDEIKVSGFKEEELNRAKIFCKSLLVSSNELGQDIAKSNATSLTNFNRIILTTEKLEEIDKVDLNLVNELFKKIFDYNNVCGAVVGKNIDDDLFKMFD